MQRTAPRDAPEAATVRIRRAVAFAAVGSLVLAVPAVAGRLAPPLATVAAVGPFVLVAAVSLYGVTEGVVFEVFARPGDREQGRLYGLAGFSLAVAVLALFAVRFGMPPGVFVGSVLLVVYGNLAQRLVSVRATDRPTGWGRASGDGGASVLGVEGDRTARPPDRRSGGRWDGPAALIRRVVRDPAVPVVAFAGGGILAALAGVWVAVPAETAVDLPLWAFLVASGALMAALVRSVLFERDDPLVLLSVGLLLWLVAELSVDPPAARVGVGLALAVGFGALAYAIGAASITGMLAGVLLALLAVVLGGYGWFAVLVSFFGLGGLVSKYRYEEKLARDVAQANEGARSSGNVLANATAALVALLGFAASGRLGVGESVFLFAYVGSVAAAMSDTFSSEIGGLFDRPRLVTTLEPVEPGTDGGVTWQGEIAGIAGAGVIAAVAVISFDIAAAGAAAIVAAGAVGMTVDSVLGATVEGGTIGNQGVNLVATFAGAIVAGAIAVGLGL